MLTALSRYAYDYIFGNCVTQTLVAILLNFLWDKTWIVDRKSFWSIEQNPNPQPTNQPIRWPAIGVKVGLKGVNDSKLLRISLDTYWFYNFWNGVDLFLGPLVNMESRWNIVGDD